MRVRWAWWRRGLIDKVCMVAGSNQVTGISKLGKFRFPTFACVVRMKHFYFFTLLMFVISSVIGLPLASFSSSEPSNISLWM